jgi:hypothetical protein
MCQMKVGVSEIVKHSVCHSGELTLKRKLPKAFQYKQKIFPKKK